MLVYGTEEQATEGIAVRTKVSDGTSGSEWVRDK
jgi:hypothetical protein